jgi:hypothetical protein
MTALDRMFTLAHRSAPEALLTQYGSQISLYACLRHWVSEDDLCKEYNAIPDADRLDDNLGGKTLAKHKWLANQMLTCFSYERNTHEEGKFLWPVAQYSIMENLFEGDEKYLLLQIHQQGDLTGGYSETKLFLINPDLIGYLMDDAANYYLDAGHPLNPYPDEIYLMVSSAYVSAYNGEGEDVVAPVIGNRKTPFRTEGSAFGKWH